MSKFFSYSQSEAKKFLENSKTSARVLGLKLVVERSKKPTPSTGNDTETSETPPNIALETPEEPTHGKLLIVIPRRVANACGRNLIRRRLKAIYTENKLFKNTKRYALFVYPEAKALSYQQLAEFLTKAL